MPIHKLALQCLSSPLPCSSSFIGPIISSFIFFFPYINIHVSKKKKIKVYILSPNNNSGTKTIPNIIIWLNGPNKELQVPAMNEEVIKVFFEKLKKLSKSLIAFLFFHKKLSKIVYLHIL